MTIDDASEQEFLQATFSDEAYWIGLSDAAEEGTFVWSSGETVNYTNWGTSYPLGDTPNYYDYVYLAQDGFWYNSDWNQASRVGIVEIPSETGDADADGLPGSVGRAAERCSQRLGTAGVGGGREVRYGGRRAVRPAGRAGVHER